MSLDTANCVSDVLNRLGFINSTDIALSTSWVNVTELYQWADEAGKKLAYKSGIFMTYDTSVTVTNGTAAYTLPASHVFTMAAWLVNHPLRITPVRELWALDATWSATSGPSDRCCFDADKVTIVTLYPNPTVGGALNQVCQLFPGTLALGSSTISLPTVLQDFFSYSMMAGARGKESDAAMPEIAEHCEERLKLYEQVIEHLWGRGQ